MTWLVGQSVPSVRSQTIQNQEGWLVYERAVLPFRVGNLDREKPCEIQQRKMS